MVASPTPVPLVRIESPPCANRPYDGDPPATRAVAGEMIAEVKSLQALAGYRGQPKGDLDALADAIVAFSSLATSTRPVEAEINPLLVFAKGVVAVDAVVRVADPAGTPLDRSYRTDR